MVSLMALADDFDYLFRLLRGTTRPNKKSTVLVAAIPASAGVAAKPAVMSPVFNPNPDLIGSCQIDTSNVAYTKYTAFLPYSPIAEALGIPIDEKQIYPMSDTSPYISIAALVARMTTIEPLTVSGKPASLEQKVYAIAKQLPTVAGTTNTIAPTIYTAPSGAKIAAIGIEVYISASGGGYA
jgi:hypothetical protein